MDEESFTRRRKNLLEVLGDEHPEVPAPPSAAATSWTEEQIRAYFASGGCLPKAVADIRGSAAPRGDEAPQTKPLRCQRIGCDATYVEGDENPEGCCRYHPGPPVFHDGGKEWGCCKARSHDFGLFMSLRGCSVGRHTQEKPAQPAKAAMPAAAAPVPLSLSQRAADSSVNRAARESCNRCAQGFFCSDHADAPPPKPVALPRPPADPDAVQTCRNKGCGLKFTERENTEKACSHHPGPPIFHERQKGWACCNQIKYDFDDFLKIPNCALGRHSADPDAGGTAYGKTAKR